MNQKQNREETREEIDRLISNREYEGLHPVKRFSAGLWGIARAVLLAEELGPEDAPEVMAALRALADRIDCAKCKCKVLAFARALARCRAPDRVPDLDRAIDALEGISYPFSEVDTLKVEREVQAVLQSLRDDPDKVVQA